MSVDGKPGHDPKGELSPEERAAFERRSNELGRKLEQARQTSVSGRRPASGGGRQGNGGAMGRAMRLSAELVSGVVVGGAIGWWLDRWLDNQKPWLFILFFLLGAGAGMLNLIRAATRETTPPPASAKDDGDEKS